MKRLLCLLLTIALCVPVTAVCAYGAEETTAADGAVFAFAEEITAVVEENSSAAQENAEGDALPEEPMLISGQEEEEGEEGGEPETPVYNPDYVADLYLMSNASGFPSLGHVWIYIENKSPNDIQVGCYTCPAGEGVSVGCFALTRSDGAGVYYNIESYCANLFPEKLKSCFHMVTPMNEEQLAKVSNYILHANWWDPMVVNCVFFALTCWNKAGGRYMFPWRMFPFFAKIAIKRMGEPGVDMFDPGRDRVFKQRGSGDNARMESVKDGSVDTVPG